MKMEAVEPPLQGSTLLLQPWQPPEAMLKLAPYLEPSLSHVWRRVLERKRCILICKFVSFGTGLLLLGEDKTSKFLRSVRTLTRVYRDLHQMIFPCLGEFLLGDLTHI